jgi:hypothetical protein
MSLVESKGALAKAGRDLFSKWQDARANWSDAQADAFEKKFLLPLEDSLRAALGAMDQLNVVLQKVERDCE